MRLTIQSPAGSEHTIDATDRDSRHRLSDFLETHLCPLNTRCGGIGRCRGCEVVTPDTGKVVKACQSTVADALELGGTLKIPARSWRDHSVQGVSAFEIRGTPPRHESRHGIGIALDIGTTTLAGAIWDLPSGKCLAQQSTANPQRRFGDNVASRVGFAVDEPDATERLQQALITEGLQPLISELLGRAGKQAGELTDAVAAGNPVMLHTLAGESLAGFAAYPFLPCFLDERETDLPLLPGDGEITIRLLPSLGAFVGADVAAGALAAGWLDAGSTELLIDFGTNGEILLKHGRRYFAAATAAGPAFEGGRLQCGRTAGPGVIGSLDLESGSWKPGLCGDDHARPIGLAGAAYIDFLHHARRIGLLDERGRLSPDHPLTTTQVIDGSPERIAEVSPSVVISEADIAELLQAKAAIGGGVATLLERAGISPSSLDRLTVAGGFGFHLGKEAGLSTGLFPQVPVDRIQALGNTSLGGASLLLLHGSSEPLEPLLKDGECIELNQCDSFEDHYIEHLSLP